MNEIFNEKLVNEAYERVSDGLLKFNLCQSDIESEKNRFFESLKDFESWCFNQMKTPKDAVSIITGCHRIKQESLLNQVFETCYPQVEEILYNMASMFYDKAVMVKSHSHLIERK